MIKNSPMKLCAAAVMAALCWSSSVGAADNTVENTIQQLQMQIMQLQSELTNLKTTVQANQVKAQTDTATTAAAVATIVAAKPAPDTKASDKVSLSETPGGFRIIDTATTTLGFYGLIDLTMATSSSGGPNANPNAATGGVTNKRWTGMDVSWMNGSRWGFTGAHLLDKDSQTRVVLRLEGEYEPPTGNFDGGYGAPVLFNRDAWVGFESPSIGKITFGRQDSLGRDVDMIWANPFTKAKNSYDEGGWMNNQIMYQLMEYSGSPTGNRWDSAAVWKKDWGNVFTYVGVQFGGLQDTQPTNGGTDVVDTGKGLNLTQKAVGLGYNSTDDIWHASMSATTAKYDAYSKNVYSIGGNVRPINWLRLNGGFIRANIEQPVAFGNRTDNVWTVSTQIYPGGKMDYALAYYKVDAKNAGMNGTTLNPFDLTNAITSAADGTMSSIYGAAFYRYDTQVDFYLAFDFAKTGGGYKQGMFNGNDKINQLGLGMRYFF